MEHERNPYQNRGPDIESSSFFSQIQQLPLPLKKIFMKQAAGCLLMVALSVLLMIVMKSYEYCWGLLFALYIAYLAVSTVWKYNEGKIIKRTMLCIKATRLPNQRLYLLMRDMEETPGQQKPTQEFYVPASRMDQSMITPNTIMEVYYDPSSPIEMKAWEIIGNL